MTSTQFVVELDAPTILALVERAKSELRETKDETKLVRRLESHLVHLLDDQYVLKRKALVAELQPVLHSLVKHELSQNAAKANA